MSAEKTIRPGQGLGNVWHVASSRIMSASLPKKFTAQEVLDILEVIDYNDSTDDEDYEQEPDKETERKTSILPNHLLI
nr:piggyBac transposable element-derived protein 3-like; partial [Biomphalaria glabrata]